MGILDPAGTRHRGPRRVRRPRPPGAVRTRPAEQRGRELSMIFQNPRTALNPIRKVGQQIADVLVRHGGATRPDAPRAAVEMLTRVRIPDPERRAEAYPFELSGGMCQRVMIAMALACPPALLIADEPTTGLDVTTQAVIMDLIGELGARSGHGDDPHHPRSRAGRRVLRPHRRHACRPRRRSGADARAVRPSAPSLHGQASGRDAGRDGALAELPRSRAACPTCAGPTCRPAATAAAASGASTTAPRPLPHRSVGERHVVSLLEPAMTRAARHRRARQALRRRHARAPAARRRRRDLHHRPRRDGRAGGRIGLRQVHARAPDQPAARSDLGQHPVGRHRARRHAGARLRRQRQPRAHPDGVPGRERFAQPALHGGRRDRRSASAA